MGNKKLLKRFDKLINRQVYWLTADRLFGELEEKYSSSKRRYHTFKHIRECLKEFDQVKDLLNKSGEVEMAIFYHDFIYDINRHDDEMKSAKFMSNKLSGIGIRRDFVNNVSDLILSTKGHVPNSNPDSSYMIDIDLSIFGKSWERFFEYEKGINQEATFHEKYSLERYNKNRLFVLESFLNRERIYLTDHFRNKYEVKAKKNLEKEIKILRV